MATHESVTVHVGRDRSKTNQIAEFVTVPSKKNKRNNFIQLLNGITLFNNAKWVIVEL